MNGLKVKPADRFFAILLSAVLLLVMLPVSVLQTLAATDGYPNAFTVSVTDGEAPVADAVVLLQAQYGTTLELEDTTDADGVADFDAAELDAALAGAGIQSGEFQIVVRKDGYGEKIQSVSISRDNLSQNVDITFETAAAQTATVSVAVSGADATVELNGEARDSVTVDVGTQVSIKITPAEGAYIKTLTINGASEPVAKGEPYVDTIAANEDIAIVVTVVKEFTVTANPAQGGQILLNDQTVSALTVDENTQVKVTVKADAGYRISSLTIDGMEQVVSPLAAEHEQSVTVTSHMQITVTFVKVYTVTVTHTQNGTVTTAPETDGGKVTVETGTDMTVTADPDDNYRVSEVLINGTSDTTITGQNFNSGDVYETTLDVNQDYTIAITFAPNRYQVSADETNNGTVQIESALVDYNGSTKVNIYPDEGYTIASVQVNGKDMQVVTPDDQTAYFIIQNIVEAQNIRVTFKQTVTANMDNVSFNAADALRTDGARYVFAKGQTVTFATDKTGIMLWDAEGRIIGGGMRQQEVTLSSSVAIGKISLYYRAEGELVPWWHVVDAVTSQNPLQIVIDTTAAEVALEPEAANDYGYYSDDVSVSVSAQDQGDYSGIASVEYLITTDGAETKRETIYTYVSGEEIQSAYNGNINVDAQTNNSDNVAVTVKVTDRAGNESVAETKLKINATTPTVSVSIDGMLHAEATEGMYNAARTATVTYTDRATTFNEAAAVDGITIQANGQSIGAAKSSMIDWEHSGDTHVATIRFTADANYEWSVSYTNKAGLSNSTVSQNGDSVFKFAVDTEKPAANISMDGRVWDDIIQFLTFGIFKNTAVTVTATGTDATTGVYDILYYKSDETEVLSQDRLEELFAAGGFGAEPITVDSDERFTVYARVTDLAGNTRYVSTNGAVYDGTEGSITLGLPQANENGYYNEDVTVSVNVKDVVYADTAYSGLKRVSYKVFNMGEETQNGTLYSFDVQDPTYDQLKAEDDYTITVLAAENNSDNVKVTVYAEDNAGNTFENSIDLAINTGDTLAARIDFTDTANMMVDDTYGYYKDARTAEITLTDRAGSFDAAAATEGITFSAVDAQGAPVDLTTEDVAIGEWITEIDAEDPNQTTHKASVTFQKDGNYTWAFAYTNKADNVLETIVTEPSDSPYSFTVDKTNPTGTISVNSNRWDQILQFLTFGLYDNVKAEITATAEDAISPVTIQYYQTSNPEILTAEQLDQCTFQDYQDYSVEGNGRFVVYLKITDYAGNYIYINSDGYIVDGEGSTITLSVSDTNDPSVSVAGANGQYGPYGQDSNIVVDIAVEDAEPYSGIRSVRYWVENNGEQTQGAQLYSFEYTRDSGANSNGGQLIITDWDSNAQVNTEPEIYDGAYPEYDQLKATWNGSVTIDKTLNNSSNVVVYVETIDNAGNESLAEVKLDIDITAPTIQIDFDNDTDNAGNTYFNAQRTATITVTERSNHFNAYKATNGIVIAAVDANGATVGDAYTISAWTTQENEADPDAATHKATVFFEKDANYQWSIGYMDEAGNANAAVDVGDSVAAFDFTVDTTRPVGTVTAVSAEGREETWSDLREPSTLTFGFWSKEKITISGTAEDATSAPIAAVEYYKVKATAASDGTSALTWDELDRVSEWAAFEGLEIQSDEQFTVYLKITDLAGNYTYICTNGLIVDHTAPIEETIAPEITINPEQPINGLYNGDVNVAIQVTDPMVGGTYSGLKTVSYKVFNMGVETQAGRLYTFDVEDPKQSDLEQTISREITVDSELNNSNDVTIVVYAQDNALNASDDQVAVKIDITAPTINVTYDNNDADSGTYFNTSRTATVVITERNFNADAVSEHITNTDGIVPTISAWKKTEGSGNLDDTRWTATVTYSADGDYTFGISCTDLAGWTCSEAAVNYGASAAPTAFTIDKTAPTVSVTYDNNSAMNTNYYRSQRVATLVITEHNLEPNGVDRDRIVITMSATDDGAAATVPTVSAWRTEGNRHTATIHYTSDAMYTFDIAVRDKAGNASAEFAEQTFYVDQTAPTLEITGVANHSANNGNVIPVVSYSDTNFDAQQVSITLVGANRNQVELDGTYTDIHNGSVFTFNNFPEEKEIDDIYTLSATLTDKAGNTTTQAITFSVNRFGSAYALSEATEQLNGTYIKTPVDVVVTETNANELSDIRITLFKNNETILLSEGTDYRIDVDGGNGQWYRYTYTIFAKNFADDGVYSLSIESADAAGNSARNDQDTKNTEISFGVDSTLPIINIENLESNTTYATENLTVIMSVEDNLQLSKVVAELDGQEIRVWTGDELGEIIRNGGRFTFDIAGDSTAAHRLVIYAVDAAGNGEKISDTQLPENAAVAEDFYVTTNLWVRYYTNTPLFVGSIIGVVLLIGLIVFFIVYKRRKDEEK